jgi:hypothetical protein
LFRPGGVPSIHPGADLLPRISNAELQELGEDIKKRGLVVAITILKGAIDPAQLLDRQKRDLITKLLKASSEASKLTIAKQVKADDKTVAKVRRRLEATSEIPKLEKTVGADGKSRGRRRLDQAIESQKAAPKAPGKGSAKALSTPKDDALIAFNERVLDLVRRIANHNPTRFAATTVTADKLAKLGTFFTHLARLKISDAETSAVSADKPAREMAAKLPALEANLARKVAGLRDCGGDA